MRRLLLATALFPLIGCASLPPTHDPEGCDRVAENVKRAGSDLVVDGDLYCATSDGDCELTAVRIIAGRISSTAAGKIPIHILREEANQYDKALTAREEIAFCFPPELWFPSEGHYRGRFYLRQEADWRYHMAFYPRATKDS